MREESFLPASDTGYDSLASTYEARFGEVARDTWRGGILKLSRLKVHEACVLELGAGTGIGGRLLRRLGPRRLVGIDNSKRMIAKAKGCYDSCVVGDLRQLPFARNSFGLCVAGFDTLNHFPLPEFTVAISGRNIGKIANRFAFDVFTQESEEFLLSVDQGFQVQRLRPGLLQSSHESPGKLVQLNHHLHSMVSLRDAFSLTGWEIQESRAVTVDEAHPIPGHFALLLQRVQGHP